MLLAGMAALVLVFGLVLVGCGEKDGGGDKSVTVTISRGTPTNKVLLTLSSREWVSGSSLNLLSASYFTYKAAGQSTINGAVSPLANGVFNVSRSTSDPKVLEVTFTFGSWTGDVGLDSAFANTIRALIKDAVIDNIEVAFAGGPVSVTVPGA
jgi:hypothetical protein